MLINKQSLNAAFVAIKTIFNNAFAAAPTTWQKIAMEVPSNTSSNDYKWLSTFPKMRRWIGAKVVKNLKAYKYPPTCAERCETVKRDAGDCEAHN
ncbi:Mu-like prophage major head subunit gpT family protein [Pseudomonas aeruginosa]|uniref:Mu-like prophage major head subunit gpT family protein n=1 Tax=Pseudomonas aeruginosa TaxID=287 RepID=UPI00295F21BD|nr:Mu-like prophage major head subunit gpT family protein [Pseudomonas aeruginosa]WOT75252.1 Mu-like prophage major head subunit gpT family protein [Pseudomonas aeruginosa]